ncbi:MAG TPA: GDSL-type esterase/lipase family protein [Roseiarcus sp.]|nr:GDSL-type esterase/lipase family protein [Roseiarcus sp.]
MPARREIVVWALIVAIGALITQQVRRIDAAFAVAKTFAVANPFGVVKPDAWGDSNLAELVARARIGSSSLGPATQHALALATRLGAPPADPVLLKTSDYVAPPSVDRNFVVATIGPPNGATRLLRAAMQRPAPKAPRAASALAALAAATGSLASAASGAVSAFGELAPYDFWDRRLTILQLGDSHTAADFFTGRVRERLQEAFGTGGEAILPPGRPHIGVRSALFSVDATSDWSYDSFLHSDERKRVHISGYNANAHHAAATLTFKSRNDRVYNDAQVSFLEQPNGGKAEVLLDGQSVGEIDLEGGANREVSFDARPKNGDGFRELQVRTLSDAPVTVTDVEVEREGDGVSFLSIGYPGATVGAVERLDSGNLAQDIRRLAPDVIVLAFGTNEGFNDNLDIGAYAAQYEQLIRRLRALRPGMRIVIVGPADAARPTGQCHAAGVGQHCQSSPLVQTAAMESSGKCRLPVPPKLNPVREAQRRLAHRIGVAFWDWSSVQGGVCGAQVWAAANPPLMAHDYVHMTLEGYKQSADRFADFLIPLIEGRQTATHVVSNN